MPDWKAQVKSRLVGMGLPPSAEDEIVAELASHLEDSYEDQRTQGHNDSESEKRAMESTQWRKLARQIRAIKSEEGLMRNRKETLWLPTFANLLLLTLALQAMFFLGIHPQTAVAKHMWFSFPVPWLLVLPFSGAAGALLAKRAGAHPKERLLAGFAPSLVWLGEFCVMAAAFTFEQHDFSSFMLSCFVRTALWWVVFPGLAQLLGTVPFLSQSEPAKA